MKNKEFFYQQYNKINWENQEKTKINSLVYNFIIKDIISKKDGKEISLFDIGFGIGFFFKFLNKLKFGKIYVEGCEPSNKNYLYFTKNNLLDKKINIKTYNKTFQDVQITKTFDFITSIYTFTAFVSEDLENITKKIYSILKEKGQFILVVANEKYLIEKLKTKKDLFIEEDFITFFNKKYKEILHYSDLPEIGKIIDYNREDLFYVDLFEKNKFKLVMKEDLNDSGFICTVFVFEKV